MKIQNLRIEREQSWTANQVNPLEGRVQIEGLHGKMEVKLSGMVISKIFDMIKDDVIKTSDYNARQASEAVDDAIGEQALLSNELAG